MLFQDNKVTFCFQLGSVSMFYMFYDLRKTETPSAKGDKLVNVKILKEDTEIFNKNFNIKYVQFINTRHLSKALEYLNFPFDGEGSLVPLNVEFISTAIKLIPNLYLILGNKFEVDSNYFSDNYLNIISNNCDFDSEPLTTFYKKDFRDFLITANNFNDHLWNQLKEYGIWQEYCEKTNLSPNFNPNNLK